jgi:uncharacterized protein (DUF58 family)
MNSSTNTSSISEEIPSRFSSTSAGSLLTNFGLLTLGGILLLSVWYGQSAIAILLSLVLGMAAVAKLWSRVCLVNVQGQRSISERRIFPGENTELKWQIINRKILPLPWVQIEDEIPQEIAPDTLPQSTDRPRFRLFARSSSLLWYRKVSWKCSLQGQKRGYYPLGPVLVSSGDIFGFYPRWAKILLQDSIIVYPKIFPLDQLQLPSLHPLGETRTERRIFQDPARTIGVRDYRPQDSLKSIHWKATARQQGLQVKVFEPTTTLKIAIFLAIDSFSGYGFFNEEDFEFGISVAASIAHDGLERSNPVGIFSNTRLADSGQEATIPLTGSRDHIMGILEALAKVTPHFSIPFETFLQRERSNLPFGTTLILIFSKLPENLAWLLNELREAGYKTLVLQIGGEKEANVEQAFSSPSITRLFHMNQEPSGIQL